MASVMKKKFIDKIDNIRAEFPLLEANLPCYSFLSIESSMPICITSLYHFDRVTDPELLTIISGMNKTTCSSDPFPTRLLMSHLHAIVLILQHIVNLCVTRDFPISCKSSILRIHRRHTKVHKYPQYNSVRHLSDQPIIQRHGYTGISL